MFSSFRFHFGLRSLLFSQERRFVFILITELSNHYDFALHACTTQKAKVRAKASAVANESILKASEDLTPPHKRAKVSV